MAAYSFSALDNKGRTKSGVLEADSPKLVRQQLRAQGLTPIQVELSERSYESKQNKSWFAPSISTNDLALITRQLSTLVAASIPIDESLKAVIEQTEKAHLNNLLSSVRTKVLEGHSLADSMKSYSRVFDNLYCAMVAAGEKSGHLDTVLLRLADYTEKRQHLKNKLMQAMIYPVVLTLVAISVVIILLSTVVPKVVEQVVHMGQTLPFSTQFLLSISHFIRDFGPYILIVLIMGIVGFTKWLHRPANRQKFDALILRLPVIRRISKGLNTARFARTLSILNASAVPLLDAIQISGEVLTNSEARYRMANAKESVREGASLRTAMSQTNLFPPMMLHMIASGERSGELDQMLERAADNQDNEFESQISIALSLFEPALVVTMAVVVLFIVLSILQPILQLNNLMSH